MLGKRQKSTMIKLYKIQPKNCGTICKTIGQKLFLEENEVKI